MKLLRCVLTGGLLPLSLGLALLLSGCKPATTSSSTSSDDSSTRPPEVSTPESSTTTTTTDPPKPETPTTETPAPKPETPSTSKPEESPKPTSETPKPDTTKTTETPKPTTDTPQPSETDVPKVAARPVVPPPVKDGITLEWNQWGGSSIRNNTPQGKNIPVDWNIGEFDEDTGAWKKEKAKNIKWVARLGSQSYGNPVIADGKVFVGTNNGGAWLTRYPGATDLGCLLCFAEADGKFLWQHSSEKLPTGRVHDWPLQGICCSPYVEGKRLWFVTSRGEVRCLDTEGFHDDENDGPFTSEDPVAKDEADVIWVLDMMGQLGISQHNMCSCSITCTGNILWVCTSNGVDESHINLPAPGASSFLAVDKDSGKVLWSDDSPGKNILHGQWSSPTYAVLGGAPQVMFAGGDSWLYSFLGEATPDGKAKLLWEFDANPKTSKYILGGRGTRNEIIATPVVYDNKVYLAVGQDPEHGEGIGHLWCIDPTKRGDVSAELAFSLKNPNQVLPKRRLQAVVEEDGEVARPNPNSAVVWHYDGCKTKDLDGSGKIGDFGEEWHRTIGTVAIKNDLLFVSDFSGLILCIDAKTGEPYWTHDSLAAYWSSPLVVEDKMYIGDEEGKVLIFRVSKTKELLAPDGENGVSMGNSVYSTPVVANNVLYIANKDYLFAIQEGAQP